ncbi:MAG: hypothetical protein JXD19_10340 [Deltaproteobacteria bacterium]|nr:hypothetical protein [Deltaproteobacteria bacterium]
MSTILFIALRKDPRYQLLSTFRNRTAGILTDRFRLGDLLDLECFSWFEKRMLKELFGGDYSEVVGPGLRFTSKNGTWRRDDDTFDTKHVSILKILNRVAGHGEFPIGSVVCPGDTALVNALAAEWNRVFEEEVGEVGYEITEAMLTFIANGLTRRLGSSHPLDYTFVDVFMECLYEYDNELVRQFLHDEQLFSEDD